MDLLNRITIKSRMVMAFVLLLLLLVLFGVFSINGMNELSDLTFTLYKHPLQVSNAALMANTGVLRMHRNMKDVSTSQTDMEIHNAVLAVQVEEKRVYKNLDIAKKYILGREGKELVLETIELFAGWKPIRVEVKTLVIEKDREAASRITRGKGADYVFRLEQKLIALSSYARNKADGFMQSAQDVRHRILVNTIIFISAAALLSLLIAYFMITSILSSISALRHTMSEITATGNLVKSEPAGNNEITEMAQHFNAVIDRLEGQFWLKDGQTALGDELSGDLSYEDLATKSTNFVSRYVEACTGALYAYNEDLSLCELKASYAFVEKEHFSKEFKLGEGIVGQVAVEKKPILLKGITREEALGNTGTVSEPPKSIYAIPLVYEEKLYGILEVASFEEIDKVKMEFLDTVAGLISVSLYTATQRQQIEGLLGTTQRDKEELEAQTEELQAMSDELQQRSEELQEQNVELEAQRHQVVEANRLKSEFLSNMSHELRTPLNSVIALSRVLILQSKEKLSKEETGYLDIIERNGKRLLSLINDILDLSKIEAGKMDLRPSSFSPGGTIEAIMESLGPISADKGLEIIQEIPPDLPRIESDEERLHQILQNLIGNAVKFTDKGSVTVSAKCDEENFTVRVQDTGIGISEKDLPHIFEEFRQVDGTSSRQYEGTGLGLAIASRTARMLGGGIMVKSTLGKGSTFTLTLPIRWKETLPKGEPLTVRVPQEIIPGQKTILVVEDSEAGIIQIRTILRKEGYGVDVAQNGQEALDHVAHTIPDGIVLDLMMPEVDGFEVLEKLRGQATTANVPVLILTAKDLTPEDLKKLSANNIQQLVQKGDVDPEGLLSGIRTMLGRGTEPETENPQPATRNSQPARGTAGKPVTILVVEDNPDNMTTLRAVLGNSYNMLEATDGKEGLRAIFEERPDLVLLDISLPEMDGYQVVQDIKENKEVRNIPVIAMTAHAMKGDREKIIAAGCDDYISKPINPETVLDKIRYWVEG